MSSSIENISLLNKNSKNLENWAKLWHAHSDWSAIYTVLQVDVVVTTAAGIASAREDFGVEWWLRYICQHDVVQPSVPRYKGSHNFSAQVSHTKDVEMQPLLK